MSSTLPVDSRRYATRDGLDHNTVLSLRQSADGHLWIRTFGSALTEFDGREFHTYVVGQRIGDMIGSLAEDRAGNLWLGTVARGALKIMRQGWTAYDQADGLGESVASIFETAAGDLYVNSSGWQVSRFDGRKFTTIRARLAGDGHRSQLAQRQRNSSGPRRRVVDYDARRSVSFREGRPL